ncbi:MAG TPA: DUF819 family protein [Parasegetibacter sp.]
MILTVKAAPLVSNDVLLFGILMVMLALIQYASGVQNRIVRKICQFFPPLLMMYFFPGLLNSMNVISGEDSELYDLVVKCMLPAGLVLFTLSVDMKELWRLRKKAGLMFLAGAVGVIIGGPLTILIVKTFAPGIVGGTGDEAVWRGLATVAGSWIGGSANLAALNEVFKPSPQLLSSMVILDTIIANLWLAILLYGVSHNKRINKFFKADETEVEKVRVTMESYQVASRRIPSLTDTLAILAVGFGGCALAYLFANPLVEYIGTNFPELERFSLTSSFFWVVIFSTTIGVALSFTKLRNLEGAGASQIATLFLYMFIMVIGMRMDIFSVVNYGGILFVGLIWLCFHALMMLVVGRIFKVPYFFYAVSGVANLGGAVQASLVASYFHRSLAPVGVLLSVLGYVLGNYGGYLCGILMQIVSE